MPTATTSNVIEKIASELRDKFRIPTPVSPAPAKDRFSEKTVAAVFKHLDADLARECRSHDIPEEKRPSTCRNDDGQATVAAIFAAFGMPKGSMISITRDVVARVSPVAHAPIATALIDVGEMPSTVEFTETQWVGCSAHTQGHLVLGLAKALGFKPLQAW